MRACEFGGGPACGFAPFAINRVLFVGFGDFELQKWMSSGPQGHLQTTSRAQCAIGSVPVIRWALSPSSLAEVCSADVTCATNETTLKGSQDPALRRAAPAAEAAIAGAQMDLPFPGSLDERPPCTPVARQGEILAVGRIAC
jgi:hypothetical protein